MKTWEIAIVWSEF